MKELATLKHMSDKKESEKPGKVLGKHVISLYSAWTSQMVKIREIEILGMTQSSNIKWLSYVVF